LLVKRQRGFRRDPMVRGETAGGAQHQIVVAKPGERAGLGTADRERQGVGRRRNHLIADIGEGNEAVEQVVAVGAASGDVQIEIDLGRRELGKGRRAQPPRSVAVAGGGPRPCASLPSIGGMSSLSGPNCSARCHW
jgi:hypothetical protein